MKTTFVKNKEYYRQYEKLMKGEISVLQYCITQAETCKHLYNLTKDRSKIRYKMLNRLAMRLNEHYVNKGMKLGKDCLAWTLCEMKELVDTYGL